MRQGAFIVKVSHLKIGQETRPRTTKTNLEDVPVRLIPQAAIPDDYPTNQLEDLRPDMGLDDRSGSGCSNNSLHEQQWIGRVSVAQGDYLVLAHYSESQDFKHMGSLVTADDPDWLTDLPIEKHLMVMEKFNGKKVAGKTTRLKGSLLLITEPEFVVWDSDQEQYPFVFESVGEWGVEPPWSPPEGFVADNDAAWTPTWRMGWRRSSSPSPTSDRDGRKPK